MTLTFVSPPGAHWPERGSEGIGQSIQQLAPFAPSG